jgi:hypothetical protein
MIDRGRGAEIQHSVSVSHRAKQQAGGRPQPRSDNVVTCDVANVEDAISRRLPGARLSQPGEGVNEQAVAEANGCKVLGRSDARDLTS